VIGLDTNILVRYLTQDDAAQARKVDHFFADNEGEVVRIDDIVVCELVWVLRAAYRVGKSGIISTLDKILSTARFTFEDRELLRNAVDDYRRGNGDLADYILGRRNMREGCDHTVTLDRALANTSTFNTL
jgi:predicted nucleic-acid-binding protein